MSASVPPCLRTAETRAVMMLMRTPSALTITEVSFLLFAMTFSLLWLTPHPSTLQGPRLAGLGTAFKAQILGSGSCTKPHSRLIYKELNLYLHYSRNKA